MKRVKFLFALSVALAISTAALATTSTINPAIPAQNSPLSSAGLRANFLAAYNDITAILGDLVNAGISAITGDLTCTGTGSVTCSLANNNTARTNLGLGTAATSNTGTSGATIPLLNGSLTFSGVDKHNLNAASLPSPITGTILQLGNADATVSRVELDAFGAAGHFSIAGYGGTAASPTALAVSTTSPFGSYNFFGYDGTNKVGPNAAVRAYPSQNWSVGSNGTQLDFAVTPNGSTTLTQAFVINQDGGLTTPGVTGGSKGANTINVGAAYVQGTLVGSGGGGSTQVAPLSLTTTDTAGNLFPYTYVGSGNASPAAPAWGVVASLGSNVVLQGRFLMPHTIPSTGALNLVSVCQTSATSGVIKYTVSDADVNTAGAQDPSAATLTAETQNSITVPGTAGFYFLTATPLTSGQGAQTAGADHISNVAVTFNTSGWTLAQILACNWFEEWR